MRTTAVQQIVGAFEGVEAERPYVREGAEKVCGREGRLMGERSRRK